MNNQEQSANRNADWQRTQPTYENEPDLTPRREGGDDALAEASPGDPRNDEKVLVNNPKTSTGDSDSKAEGDSDGKIAD